MCVCVDFGGEIGGSRIWECVCVDCAVCPPSQAKKSTTTDRKKITESQDATKGRVRDGAICGGTEGQQMGMVMGAMPSRW